MKKQRIVSLILNLLLLRAEVEDFFKRMDRDYDGRLSFGEFMGEETPLEKVNISVLKPAR